MGNQQNIQAKPFLRWAGGKNWLIKYSRDLFSKISFENYHEPFLGGGSMYFSLQPTKKAFLSDLNVELIRTYKAVKAKPDKIIEELKKFRNTEKFYYKIRDRKFDDSIKNAAKFIYLNQTSFNGIYRVNLKGNYNVPYGYRTKNFLEEENLRNISDLLKKAVLFHGDFEIIKDNLKAKDLVFLDPPYTVSHNLNGFIKYNQRLFSLKDQYRLSNLIDFIKSKNAYYLLTNAAHMKILEIFDKQDRVIELQRANLIGGQNAKRGKISEYIFTNYK